jgi:hypothetical protein
VLFLFRSLATLFDLRFLVYSAVFLAFPYNIRPFAFRSSMTASSKDFSALTVGDLKLLIYATTVETRIVGDLGKLFRSF